MFLQYIYFLQQTNFQTSLTYKTRTKKALLKKTYIENRFQTEISNKTNILLNNGTVYRDNTFIDRNWGALLS